MCVGRVVAVSVDDCDVVATGIVCEVDVLVCTTDDDVGFDIVGLLVLCVDVVLVVGIIVGDVFLGGCCVTVVLLVVIPAVVVDAFVGPWIAVVDGFVVIFVVTVGFVVDAGVDVAANVDAVVGDAAFVVEAVAISVVVRFVVVVDSLVDVATVVPPSDVVVCCIRVVPAEADALTPLFVVVAMTLVVDGLEVLVSGVTTSAVVLLVTISVVMGPVVVTFTDVEKEVDGIVVVVFESVTVISGFADDVDTDADDAVMVGWSVVCIGAVVTDDVTVGFPVVDVDLLSVVPAFPVDVAVAVVNSSVAVVAVVAVVLDSFVVCSVDIWEALPEVMTVVGLSVVVDFTTAPFVVCVDNTVVGAAFDDEGVVNFVDVVTCVAFVVATFSGDVDAVPIVDLPDVFADDTVVVCKAMVVPAGFLLDAPITGVILVVFVVVVVAPLASVLDVDEVTASVVTIVVVIPSLVILVDAEDGTEITEVLVVVEGVAVLLVEPVDVFLVVILLVAFADGVPVTFRPAVEVGALVLVTDVILVFGVVVVIGLAVVGLDVVDVD